MGVVVSTADAHSSLTINQPGSNQDLIGLKLVQRAAFCITLCESIENILFVVTDDGLENRLAEKCPNGWDAFGSFHFSCTSFCLVSPWEGSYFIIVRSRMFFMLEGDPGRKFHQGGKRNVKGIAEPLSCSWIARFISVAQGVIGV
jgi:hypothetical protein